MTERLTEEEEARCEEARQAKLALAQSALRETGRGVTTLIAELDALEAKATPVPWMFRLRSDDPDTETMRGPDDTELRKIDGKFAVALRNAYPIIRKYIGGDVDDKDK